MTAALIDATHAPCAGELVLKRQCHRDFPIQNLPLGIFSEAKGRRRPCVAIGDYILDLSAVLDLLDEDWREDLAQPVLNAWLARGPRPTGASHAPVGDSVR